LHDARAADGDPSQHAMPSISQEKGRLISLLADQIGHRQSDELKKPYAMRAEQ
jgi:hypothetical protein